MSNLIFTGTRDVSDINFIKGALHLFYFDISEIKNIWVGCAKGVDEAVREFSRSIGIDLRVFKADWDGLGKIAGLIRNEEMLIEAEKEFTVYGCDVIALPCDSSKGTISCAVLARHKGFRVWPYTYEFHLQYISRYVKESKNGFTYLTQE